MKRSFLRQPYEAALPAIEATETSETATFVGQPDARKQFNVSPRQSSPAELTDRSGHYSH